jgi:hypothetical protein
LQRPIPAKDAARPILLGGLPNHGLSSRQGQSCRLIAGPERLASRQKGRFLTSSRAERPKAV